jgi:hypothetical protein
MARITISGEPSYISTPSSEGAQVFVHVTLTRSGALDVIRLAIDEERRVIDVERSTTSRRRLREMFDNLARGSAFRAAPAPSEYVAWRIQQAVAHHRAAGGRLLASAEEALAALPTAAAPPPHPIASVAKTAGDDAPMLVARSAELLDVPELRGWILPLPAVRAMLTALSEETPGTEAAASSLIVSAAAMAEKPAARDVRAERAERAIDDYFTPEHRAELATRLRDVALVLDATRRPDAAVALVATAEAVEAASVLTTPPHQIPFVSALGLRSMQLAASAMAERTRGPNR